MIRPAVDRMVLPEGKSQAIYRVSTSCGCLDEQISCFLEQIFRAQHTQMVLPGGQGQVLLEAGGGVVGRRRSSSQVLVAGRRRSSSQVLLDDHLRRRSSSQVLLGEGSWSRQIPGAPRRGDRGAPWRGDRGRGFQEHLCGGEERRSRCSLARCSWARRSWSRIPEARRGRRCARTRSQGGSGSQCAI